MSNRWVLGAWLACAFVAGLLVREQLPVQVAVLPDGGVYQGALMQGKMQGVGEIQWPDGSVYRGEFVNGLFHGQGVLEYADGERWEGEWYAGELDQASMPAAIDHSVEARLEQALYTEQLRLQQQLATVLPGVEGNTELYFLGVAGDGTQKVFGKEIDFIQQQLQQRYPLQGHSIVLVNDRERIGTVSMATRTSVEQALQMLGKKMNAGEDVLLVYMTSHGSEAFDFVLDQQGLLLPDLSAQDLQQLLDSAGIRWQVVIVSACFSGGVIPFLQNADRLVMTSAAADRASFGCSDDSEMTYFGRALFSEAFPHHAQWPDMFAAATHWIEQREQQEQITPSLPQMAVGDNILLPLARLSRRDQTP